MKQFFKMAYLLAFGSNGSGQLGLGHYDDISAPEQVKFSEEDPFNLSGNLNSGNFVHIACGGNHTIVVNSLTGSAYGSGDNSVYQLGLDKINVKTNVFTKICSSDKYNHNKWTFAAAGWETSILIDNDGAIFTSGTCSQGELGILSKLKTPTTQILSVHQQFTRIPKIQLKSVPVKASSGLHHVVILCKNGDVWGWGGNRKGQVCALDENPLNIDPIKLPHKIASGVTDIGCGKDFTVLLIKDEKEKSFIKILGNHRLFKNNLNDYILEKSPIYISQLAVGWTSIHLTIYEKKSKKIWAFGNNSHGQLYPFRGNITNTNIEVKNFKIHEFQQIVAGTEHYLSMETTTEEHKPGDKPTTDHFFVLYSWGWGEHGNCGPNYSESEPGLHEICTFEKSVKSIHLCGGYASSWIFVQK